MLQYEAEKGNEIQGVPRLLSKFLSYAFRNILSLLWTHE